MENHKSSQTAPAWRDRLIENRKSKIENSSSRFDGQHLPAAIIPARWAGGVGRDPAPALAAFAQLAGVPAVGGLARAQAHLRGFAFWDSHD
jgi:hypothetical protein